MQVKILPFGMLKELLGSAEASVDLPEGSTVAELLLRLQGKESLRPVAWKSIAVSVNAEYAIASHVLREGDEVVLLPPVSGGSQQDADVIALTREPIDAKSLIEAAKRGEDGAIVIFDGIVRNHTRGRQTLHLDYEAY